MFDRGREGGRADGRADGRFRLNFLVLRSARRSGEGEETAAVALEVVIVV